MRHVTVWGLVFLGCVCGPSGPPGGSLRRPTHISRPVGAKTDQSGRRRARRGPSFHILPGRRLAARSFLHCTSSLPQNACRLHRCSYRSSSGARAARAARARCLIYRLLSGFRARLLASLDRLWTSSPWHVDREAQQLWSLIDTCPEARFEMARSCAVRHCTAHVVKRLGARRATHDGVGCAGASVSDSVQSGSVRERAPSSVVCARAAGRSAARAGLFAPMFAVSLSARRPRGTGARRGGGPDGRERSPRRSGAARRRPRPRDARTGGYTREATPARQPDSRTCVFVRVYAQHF